MTTAMDDLVLQIVTHLDARLRDDFEERAAIMEFEGNLIRRHAECLALLDLLRRYPGVLAGVTAVQVDLGGATHWILTTDLTAARQRLTKLSGTEIGVTDLVRVINERFGGFVWLTAEP